MKLSKVQLQLLCVHGFKWYKDQSTDEVSDSVIKEVIPSANGFTVVYKSDCLLESTTAVVDSIDWPEDYEAEWIYVHWKSLEDQQRNEGETVKFCCPNCKHNRLEEVMTNVIVSSIIDDLNCSGDFEYGLSSKEEGEIEHYQCANCGFVIPGATEPVQVIEWIKDQ